MANTIAGRPSGRIKRCRSRVRFGLGGPAAAHAIAAGLILVTNNEREFRRVPGLNLENWAAPSTKP